MMSQINSHSLGDCISSDRATVSHLTPRIPQQSPKIAW